MPQMNEMNKMKIVRHIVVITFSLIFSGLLAAYLTGRKSRQYETFEEQELIRISDRDLKLYIWAHEYKPVMYAKDNNKTAPLLWTWFEAIDNTKEETVDFVYYFNWENETNPQKSINFLYTIFRYVYYGYSLNDIEYYQVNVDKRTGLVKRIIFETSETDNYNLPIVKHIVSNNIRIDSVAFRQIHKTTNGDVIKERQVRPIFDKSHILSGVKTWNHMTCFLSKSNADDYSTPFQEHLKFLSDYEYSSGKFSRKSQGNHKTKQNFYALALWFLYISSILIIAYFKFHRRSKV